MMGSGKTSVGREVAASLGIPFLDSDEEIERRTGRTVREIFEAEGEPAFRKLETEALEAAVDQREPHVIAAAGGVVLDPRNRELLRRAGTVVWLRAAPEVLARRVGGWDHRPLLGDDPLHILRQLDAERSRSYADVAAAVVDVDDLAPEQVAARVVELVR
jgi:shikimate kinase